MHRSLPRWRSRNGGPVSARDLDVLVVGAGPGGCIAALEAARSGPGLDVLLIERDPAIGAPVRCAEGVDGPGLREFICPDGADWVGSPISKIAFVAPDGTAAMLDIAETAYVLDRTRFEPALAALAASEGAEVRTGTEASGMRRDGDRWAVSLDSARGTETVRARVIIGADGVESMVGRWAGIDTRVPSRGMESCAQYTASGIDFDPGTIYLQFGNDIAPYGYGWIFPRSAESANVGLGMLAMKGDGRTACQYLDSWIARRYSTATLSGRTVGGVIVSTTPKRISADGVMIVGDAAHMINPLTGGGIVSAMRAGRLAGGIAARQIAAGDVSAAALAEYRVCWMELLGDSHERLARIKRAVDELSDDFFNGLARTVNAIAREKRTMKRVLLHALVRHPQLVPVVARLFV